MTNQPFMVMAVREHGDDGNGDYWLPMVEPSGNLQLSAGEQLVYFASAEVSGSVLRGKEWVQAWNLPTPAGVWFTDRRIAFVCQEFVKSGTAIGFGGLGLAVAATTNIARSVKAANMRRGKAAVGHLRFEWLNNVIFDKTTPPPALLVKNPAPVVSLHVTTRNDAGQHFRVVFRRIKPAVNEELVSGLVRHIAVQRLASPPAASFGGDVIQELQALSASPEHQLTDTGKLLWTIPGPRQPAG